MLRTILKTWVLNAATIVALLVLRRRSGVQRAFKALDEREQDFGLFAQVILKRGTELAEQLREGTDFASRRGAVAEGLPQQIPDGGQLSAQMRRR